MNKPLASESLSTLRVSDTSTNNLCSNVSSTTNIIDADELSGLKGGLRPLPSGRLGRLVHLLRTCQNFIILISTPVILSPLLNGQPEYNCMFCVGVMAVYWMSEALPLAVTALLPVVLFPLTGVLSAKVVAREYLNDTNFLFIGGLIVAVAVEKCNLHERLALSVLRLFGSQPKWIMLGFMLATAVLSMFISNTATTAMMVPICQSVSKELMNSYKMRARIDTNGNALLVEGNPERIKPTKRETRVAKGLIISICFSANIGGTGTLTGTPPNLVLVGIMGALFSDAETGIHYLSWLAFALPMMLCCLVACWAVLVFVFLKDAPKADDSVTKVMNERYNQLPSMSFAEKSVSLAFFVLLVMWIGRDPQIVPGFGSFFPRGFFTDATSAMLIALLLFILPSEIPSWRQIMNPTVDERRTASKQSKRLMDWPTMQSKFPWSVVLLLGGGFALASGVKESGLSLIIGQTLATLNGFPTILLQLICVTVTMVVTNICSNTVTSSIFLPVVANLAQETQNNPLALMLPVTIACSFSFILPVGTPSNAIVFATGTLKVSDMVVAGFITSIVTILITVLYLNSGALLIFSLNEFPAWAILQNVTGTPHL